MISRPDHTENTTPARPASSAGGGATSARSSSGAGGAPGGGPAGSATTPSDAAPASPSVDPHNFLVLDGPTFEPCSVCDAKPSFYREKWVKGMAERRRLCKRCYGAAVRREQAAVAPLPKVIAAGSLKRVTGSVGRCGLCRLEAAAWSGDGMRLCEACYQREMRRGIEAGADVPAAV